MEITETALNTTDFRIDRLSESCSKWAELPNRWGELPCIDFAIAHPFQLLTRASASKLKAIAETYYGGANEYSTARTSCCLRGCAKLEEAVCERRSELESITSRLVGAPMRLHTMRYEWAHVNVQKTGGQERPVDNWHQDSTPFVLITVLTDHAADGGGELHTAYPAGDAFEGGDVQTTCRYKLKQAGESMLMQGSHIWHKANPSIEGERMTFVTSFTVNLPTVYDSTSIRVAIQYSPQGLATHYYLKHCLGRLQSSLTSILANTNHESKDISKTYAVIWREVAKICAAAPEVTRLMDIGKRPLETTAETEIANASASTLLIEVADRLRQVKPTENPVACTKLMETVDALLSRLNPLVLAAPRVVTSQ